MALPDDVLRKLTGHRDFEVGPYRGEQRDGNRLWVGRRGRALFFGRGPDARPEPVLIRDVSAGGAGLLYAARVARGERFVLSVRAAGDDEPPWTHVIAEAVRCERAGLGGASYVVGASLLSVVKLRDPTAASAAATPDAEIERIRRAILS